MSLQVFCRVCPLGVGLVGGFQKCPVFFVIPACGDAVEHTGGTGFHRIHDVPLFVGLFHGAGVAKHEAAFYGAEGNFGNEKVTHFVSLAFGDDVGSH